MDDETRGQAVAARQLRLADLATAQRAAFRNQFFARRAVNRAIHTTAAEQRFVGGIDNRVHRQRRNIGHLHFQIHASFSFINRPRPPAAMPP